MLQVKVTDVFALWLNDNLNYSQKLK